MSYKVLILEQDTLMREALIKQLEVEFEINAVDTGEKMLALFHSQQFDLILLDIETSDGDGFEFVKEVRKVSQIPLMVFTKRSTIEDQIKGYELAVDDYIIKPCDLNLVIAKMKRLLSRVYQQEEENYEIAFNQLVINKLARTVRIENELVNFRPKEFDLLLFLIENQTVALNRDRILDAVWGIDYFGDTRVVDTHVKKIRKKLGVHANYIHTLFGVGYKFEVV